MVLETCEQVQNKCSRLSRSCFSARSRVILRACLAGTLGGYTSLPRVPRVVWGCVDIRRARGVGRRAGGRAFEADARLGQEAPGEGEEEVMRVLLRQRRQEEP